MYTYLYCQTSSYYKNHQQQIWPLCYKTTNNRFGSIFSDLELPPKPLTTNTAMCYKTTNNRYGYEQKGGSIHDAHRALARLDYSSVCISHSFIHFWSLNPKGKERREK